MSAIIPISRVPIQIRVATLADLPWIDALHKTQGKALGYWPTKQFEGYIEGGWVLIAHEPENAVARLGYVISRDRYLKRDELGIVYQLNVVPDVQRRLIGASLLKAVFDRAAYGCRLFCCWCAQDLKANEFWEAMGFTPIAFRSGSDRKRRAHIFWQKRIREGDTETPWWFPSETKGGSMADRLVFPIPPGTQWSDAKPVILPGAKADERSKALPSPRAKKQATAEAKAPPKRVPLSGALCFAPPVVEAPVKETVEKPKPKKKPKAKNDPKLIAAARELRDRWLEHVSAGEMLLEGAGKYDVSRAIAHTPIQLESAPRLLPAA